MAILDDNTKQQLTELLVEIKKEVNILYFTGEDCPSCGETGMFLEELSELNDFIKFEKLDIIDDAKIAKEHGLDSIPSIAIVGKDKKPNGVKFYGAPSGYEIHSLISSLKEIGGLKEEFSESILERITAIDKDIHIRVFVTPTCPYCPGAVITGHRLALENDRITSDMVEATTFPELSSKYGVRGVPKIVINETYELVGNQPVTKFLELIDSIN